MTVDAWPSDDDMAEMCGCGHTLGQHSYGDDLAPCEVCVCGDFHDQSACRYRVDCQEGHIGRAAPVQRCPAHPNIAEPCAVCSAYIAAGL